MRINATSRIALVLLAIGSIHQAQTKPTAPKVAEATAAVEAELPLRVAVAGLTKENATAIKAALSQLSVQAYVCDPCKVEQAIAGQCSKCRSALQVAQRPMLASVAPTPEEASIALGLIQRRITRLSEIEAALKKSAVTIDNTKLALPGRMTLVVRGGSADKLALAEKALAEARLFEEVHAAFDAATSEIRIAVRAGATAPTRARVAGALESLQLQLVDVHFGHVLEAG